MKSDGMIVVMSYPDTVVRLAYAEFSSKLWHLFGIGNQHSIQAGHAALLLIDKNKNSVNYYDFGRYTTSLGNGRVRSKKTDVELHIPIKAVFKNSKLINIDEILLWLEAHPEKTHGSGRLIASTNTQINYQKALFFINHLMAQKEIPYGAFVKNGSNCARFVTDVILNSCTNKSIVRRLKLSYLLTPSPIGNVIKAKTEKQMYLVNHQKVQKYQNTSVLKENKACFLKKISQKPNLLGTELPNKKLFNLQNGTWLAGIGSGAWFKIEKKISCELYEVARYTVNGVQDFKEVFVLKDEGFDFNATHQIVYPTNCAEVFVAQQNKVYRLTKPNS